MDGLELFREIVWRGVPARAIDLAFEIVPAAVRAYKAAQAEMPVGVYLHAKTQAFGILPERLGESETDIRHGGNRKSADGSEQQQSTTQGALLRFDEPPSSPEWIKIANPMRTAGRWLGVFPNPHYEAIGVNPSGLTSTIAGGLVGAGLGYGGGRIAEYFLPDTWKRNRLSRTTALLGGLLGASPGIGLSVMQMAAGRPPWDRLGFEDHQGGPQPPVEWPKPPERSLNEPIEPKAAFTVRELFNLEKPANEVGYGDIPLNVDLFGRTLWMDPRVALGLPTAVKAQAQGLVDASAHLGPDPEWTTAGQIARMAMGMGAGYAGGWAAGKVLTNLFGMPPQHQEALKRTGAFAGIIGSVIPRAYGAPR